MPACAAISATETPGPSVRTASIAAATISARRSARRSCRSGRGARLTAGSLRGTVPVVTVTAGNSNRRGGTMAATGTSASAGPGIGAGDRVIVTGAAGGLASPAVARLRERGVQVIGLDVIGDEHTIACDITDDAAVSRAVAQAVQRLGGVDAVVHYAGIGTPNDAGAPLEPDALRVIDVNLLGAWRVTAAALPALLASRAERGGRRGRVLFVASELAYLTLPFVSAYSVAKRGMTAYADALRLEYGTELHVTSVYPGYVRTPIHTAGREVGLALEGQVRREEVKDVVGTVVRALATSKPP